ncbi:MAG: AraC family transcriptional regulator [Bosea sp. (in: a-proteobacteria)]
MDIAEIKTQLARYQADPAREMPDILVFQRDAPSKIEAFIYEPVLCLVLQGSKVSSIGDQSVRLVPGDALIVSHTLPVVSQITEASPEEPYLALILSLDLKVIEDLHKQLTDVPMPKSDARSLSVGPPETAWLTPLMRYVELAESPLDAQVLGPSILREVHYRLLLSPTGAMLRSLLGENSHAGRIAKAISQLRSDYRKPLRVPDLAKTAAMSASSFHDHFKVVTGTTPLQYQKDLRLIEAHALLTTMKHTVADAAFAVGYESPNQFSRDYSRKFGAPPSKVTRVFTPADQV